MVVLGSPPTHNLWFTGTHWHSLSCLVPFPLALRQVSLGIESLPGWSSTGSPKNGQFSPSKRQEIPSRNQTWRCKILHLQSIFPYKPLIKKGNFYKAMFDYQMVCFYILEIKTLWTHAHPCNPASHLMIIRDVYTINLWFLCWQIQGKSPSVIFVGPTDMSFSRWSSHKSLVFWLLQHAQPLAKSPFFGFVAW